jgi:hypothetical protein
MNPRWLVFLSTMAVALSGCALPASVYGLRPEYPTAMLDITSTPKVAFVEVDSLQPTLRWEPFPDADARKDDRDGRLSRIRDVTYDLQILGAEADYPTEVLYARSELPEASHKLETPLLPAGKYFWTIRARFTLDGITRVTPWARIRGSGSSDFVVPSRYYFGLKTSAR